MLELITTILNNSIYIKGAFITFIVLTVVVSVTTMFLFYLITSERESFPTILFMAFSILLTGYASAILTSLLWPVFWIVLILSIIFSWFEHKRREKQAFIDKLKGIL